MMSRLGGRPLNRNEISNPRISIFQNLSPRSPTFLYRFVRSQHWVVWALSPRLNAKHHRLCGLLKTTQIYGKFYIKFLYNVTDLRFSHKISWNFRDSFGRILRKCFWNFKEYLRKFEILEEIFFVVLPSFIIWGRGTNFPLLDHFGCSRKAHKMWFLSSLVVWEMCTSII